MPLVKTHCAISRKRTKGKNDFKELHEWIDKPQKEKGINHRTERHAFNLKDKNYIQREWGKKGVVEWLFHIAVDNLETAFKEANRAYKGDNAYNFFEFGFKDGSKFIHCNFKRIKKK